MILKGMSLKSTHIAQSQFFKHAVVYAHPFYYDATEMKI